MSGATFWDGFFEALPHIIEFEFLILVAISIYFLYREYILKKSTGYINSQLEEIAASLGRFSKFLDGDREALEPVAVTKGDDLLLEAPIEEVLDDKEKASVFEGSVEDGLVDIFGEAIEIASSDGTIVEQNESETTAVSETAQSAEPVMTDIPVEVAHDAEELPEAEIEPDKEAETEEHDESIAVFASAASELESESEISLDSSDSDVVVPENLDESSLNFKAEGQEAVEAVPEEEAAKVVDIDEVSPVSHLLDEGDAEKKSA